MGKRRIPEKQGGEPSDSLLSSVVVDEVDLHGLDGRMAEGRLEMFLQRCTASHPGAVVRVITGLGNRSEGDAILKPLVGRLLTGRLARYVTRFTMDSGGGAYRLKLGE